MVGVAHDDRTALQPPSLLRDRKLSAHLVGILEPDTRFDFIGGHGIITSS
jgi:hypothetical protein